MPGTTSVIRCWCCAYNPLQTCASIANIVFLATEVLTFGGKTAADLLNKMFETTDWNLSSVTILYNKDVLGVWAMASVIIDRAQVIPQKTFFIQLI